MQELLLTVSVPTWGRFAYDVGPYAAYEAARRGDFVTVQIGRKLRVPVHVNLRRLGFEDSRSIENVLARLREIMAEKKRAAA